MKNASLMKFGNFLKIHQLGIRRLQWVIVIIYIILMIYPIFLPLPDENAKIFNNFTMFAQFIFWGIWWPFVILSMMIFGRAWCGLLCPEGTLTEWSSKYGYGNPVPSWMKWRGWPFIAFSLTTVFGQIISVYQYPKPVILILGGSTITAILIGYLYGKGVRVWCKYLCPVNGVFSLLARLSPIYMNVDTTTWKIYKDYTKINCAPLINIKQMKSSSECHMCGRCNSYRNSVSLSMRPVGSEIYTKPIDKSSYWDCVLIVYGMLGIAMGAFHWTASPIFIELKQFLAQYAVEKNMMWLFFDSAPWWIMTHYPEQNDVFNLLDALTIFLYIIVTAFLLGSWIMGWLILTAFISNKNSIKDGVVELSYTLLPICGASLFIGLSSLTLNLLNITNNTTTKLIFTFRFILLCSASIFSLFLIFKQASTSKILKRLITMLTMSPCVAIVLYSWYLIFFRW